MARIRSLKPEAFTSETLAGCSVPARWTFAGLWTYADDAGRGRANTGLVKAAVWPLDDDVTGADIGRYLDELESARLICRYEVDGKSYLHVINFGEHQHPNRPVASKLPACSRRTHGGLSEGSPGKRPKAPAGPGGTAAASPEVKTGKSGRQSAKAAGQGSLTEDAVSTHGARITKSSSTPPTPLRNELGEGIGEGEGDGEGDGVQQATPAAANGPRPTPTQRSKRITNAYAEAQPMCRWPAVNGVVMHAIKSGKYADDEIHEALLRMAKSGQGVTVESLRVELEGLAPRASPGRERERAAQRQRQMDRAKAREEAG